jgi:hypothetical protein
MKTNIRHTILTILVIALVGLNTSAQNAKSFPKSISTNIILDSGTYHVKGNNVVAKGATLTIQNGTKLLFAENAVIQVEGGLLIQGQKEDFVQVSSIDHTKPGMGFSILYDDELPVDIQYADFTHIQKPLKLHKYWLRPSINITHSMFHHLNHGIYLEILEMDKIVASSHVVVTIANNTFANNTGSIMISDAAWDQLSFDISHNVFSRNEYIGRELNGIFTTPLFINYNETETQLPQPKLDNNSICYNYIGLIGPDTVDFFPVYVTTVGSADRIDISNNYFGKDAEKYLELNEEIIHAAQRAPFVEFSNPLETPLETSNGHFYKVGVNGVEVDNPGYDLHVDQFTELVELISNKPVVPSEDFDVTYVYLDDDTIRRYELKVRLDFENNNQRTKIYLEDKILKKQVNGYLEIKGFLDQNGFEVPIVNIGLRNYLNQNRDFLFMVDDYTAIPRIDMTDKMYEIKPVDTTISETQDTNLDFNNEKLILTEKYWDFGVNTSSTIYFGDLAYTSVSIYLPNARPQLGFRFGYNFNKKWKIQFAQNNLMLSGADSKETDIGKNRGPGFDRGLSFRTFVVDLGATMVYRPFKYETVKSFIPSVFAGVSGYYFNPQGQYNGRYYNLRPIGTEGQTINGQDLTYGKFGVSIPLGVQIERHISQKMLIGFGYTFHKLFHDYLDDVSTGRYPDAEELKDANPDLGDIAVKLSNPNDQTGQRSYSDDNDGFSYFGFTFTWKL